MDPDLSRSSVIPCLAKCYDLNWVKQLENLDHECCKIRKFYHEYDYSPELPGNGFRSLVRVVDLFFERLIADHDNCNLSLYPDLLEQYTILTKCLSSCLSYSLILRVKGPDFDREQQHDSDREFFHRIQSIPSEYFEPVAGPIGPFHYRGSIGPVIHWAMHVFHITKLPISSSLRMLYDSKFAATCVAKTLWRYPLRLAKELVPGPILHPMYRIAIRTSCLFLMTTLNVVTIPQRTNSWEIRVKDWTEPAVIERATTRLGSCGSILITPFTRKSKSIIIHGPGGGFITSDSYTYAVAAAILVRKTGVPVIIPDYRKAPEHKFPAALQDVFDLYMFLTSNDPEVEQVIGFQPENVYMCGDSAGANLVVATTFLLNRIRKQGSDVPPKMPSAVMLQIPAVTPLFSASPSFSLSLLDLVVPSGLAALCGVLYSDIDQEITADYWNNLTDRREIDQLLRKFGSKLKEPLINLMAFKDWEDLKDIPLFITAAEMDPGLDQAVMLAKAWKGKVRMSIAQGMPHGFTAFPSPDPTMRREVSLYENQVAAAVSGVAID